MTLFAALALLAQDAAAIAAPPAPPPMIVPVDGPPAHGAATGDPAPAVVTVPDGMVVEVVIEAALDSKTAVVGARFPIRLARSIEMDGRVLVPAGATGEGEVIHAARARAGGKAGELILTTRHVTFDGRRMPLRGLRLAMTGDRRGTEAMIASHLIAAPAALFIAGGELRVAAGTRAEAKVKGPVDWSPHAADPASADKPMIVPTP